MRQSPSWGTVAFLLTVLGPVFTWACVIRLIRVHLQMSSDPIPCMGAVTRGWIELEAFGSAQQANMHPFVAGVC